MAEGSTNDPCRYYLRGGCTRGDRCIYSHDLTPSNQDNRCKPCASVTNTCSTTSYQLPSPSQASTSSDIGLVTLKWDDQSNESGPGEELNISEKPTASEWVKAAEFVPGQMWKGSEPTPNLAAAAREVTDDPQEPSTSTLQEKYEGDKSVLCPFAAMGACRYGDRCANTHGDVCEYCGLSALHPDDEEQKNTHIEECSRFMEEDMELSFAIQRSKSKECGICMEKVLEKTPTKEQRFGIQSNCNHVFCLSCIRKWRSGSQFEHQIIRSCPYCRVKSDFITPSKYWVDDKDQKIQLMEDYKKALSNKPCKYFNQGRGKCPFGNSCFYQHAFSDGRLASRRESQRRSRNPDHDQDHDQHFILWDVYDNSEGHEHVVQMFVDEDDLDDMLFNINLNDYSSDDNSDEEADFIITF